MEPSPTSPSNSECFWVSKPKELVDPECHFPTPKVLDVCVQNTISETGRPKDTNQHGYYDDLYDFNRENHNVFIDDGIP